MLLRKVNTAEYFMNVKITLQCFARFGRQFKLYDKILPSQLLDVTDVIMSSPRQCVICGVLAEWECPQCYGSHLSGLASTAYCGQCLQVTHQHKQRRNHKQERLETPAGWSKQSQQPIPRFDSSSTAPAQTHYNFILLRILMDLVAVICIETSHYVSFVRCGDSAHSPWCFFDSMADRRGEYSCLILWSNITVGENRFSCQLFYKQEEVFR